jgi:hypothetical protein
VARADIAYAQARERIRQLESAVGELTLASAPAVLSTGDRTDVRAADGGRGVDAVVRLTIARAHLRECASVVAQQHPDVAIQLRAIAAQAGLLAGDLTAGHPTA